MARCYRERFSPTRYAAEISGEQVQASLRTSFAAWGLPQAIRVDNGTPWSTQSLVPSALVLWLVGLGIEVVFNPPRQCTANGVVERDHGVLMQWAEPQRATDIHDCQQRLDWAMDVQRDLYPVQHRYSRLQCHPALLHNPRTYSCQTEADIWSLDRVDAYVAQIIFYRRVDKTGRISLMSTAYTVGRSYARQDVTVQFDPLTREWVIRDERGIEIKRHPTQELTAERINSLHLAKRKRSN